MGWLRKRVYYLQWAGSPLFGVVTVSVRTLIIWHISAHHPLSLDLTDFLVGLHRTGEQLSEAAFTNDIAYFGSLYLDQTYKIRNTFLN